MTHLLFMQALIKEFMQFHSYGSKPPQTGPVGPVVLILTLTAR